MPALSAEPAASDPLELFTAMMPVFTHARCANCHGAVDPHAESGPLADTHAGGVIPRGGTCADSGCHTQTDDSHDETRWKTATPLHDFNGRTAKQLCEMQSDAADDLDGQMRDGYFHHLDSDFLIDLAFVGQSGGANNSTEPPPMGKREFLKAARAWLDVGHKCKSWTGNITQEETFAAVYSFPQGGAGSATRVTVNEQANRTFKLDRVDGDSTVTINQGGRQTVVSVTHTTGLHGPCTFTTTMNSDWEGQNKGPAPGDVFIRIAPDGSYSIRFTGPAENTVSNDNGQVVSDCGGLIPAPIPGTTPLDWDPWQSTIHCPPKFTVDTAGGDAVDCDLFDPVHNPRLKGRIVRVLTNHEDAADQQSWMEVSPVGNSRADDGSSLPITVITTWDFSLPP